MFGVYTTKIRPAKQFLISFLEPGFQLLKNLTAELAEHAEKEKKDNGIVEQWNNG